MEYDTFANGIGITTLASERGPIDDIRESSPVAISGVALPEDTALEGGQGVRHFYSPAMAERAAETLQEQLDDAEQTVHIVKNFHELEGQAAADDIIGEVTGVAYSPGVGVVFEGEITDVDTAEKIAHGYLDVSPTVARALGEQVDDQLEARPVTDVAGFRDVAIVGTGQPGAGVDVGSNPAIEALARAPALDTYSVSEPTFDGWSDAAWDAPTLSETFDGDLDAARNSATWVEGNGETFGDLSLFIVDGDGAVNVNALDSAWRLAPQTDGPDASDVDRLRRLYEGLATDAHEAGAIGQERFEDVWVPRMDDTGGRHDDTDTMSLDDAKATLADEYDIDVETLEERLAAADGGEDTGDDPPDGAVVLVESESDD
jgi:hypothetical protein